MTAGRRKKKRKRDDRHGVAGAAGDAGSLGEGGRQLQQPGFVAAADNGRAGRRRGDYGGSVFLSNRGHCCWQQHCVAGPGAWWWFGRLLLFVR
jgi:hypothetical protein